jgi:hypothetical protein
VIHTDLPLQPRITVDVPVEQMTADAVRHAQAEARARWPYLLGGVLGLGALVYVAARAAR